MGRQAPPPPPSTRQAPPPPPSTRQAPMPPAVPRRRYRRMTQTPSTVMSPCSPGLQPGGSLDEINFVSKEHEWEATPRMTMGKRIGIHARAHPSDNTNLHVNLM